ncbi:hypothetical protein [Ramlibacter sp.]|uniref:hypothetical protein n=1 Tax=Ramlibacter sp. TaxID=1917967 RepID=UPI002D6E5430|nr:hypothetical protein [Ramlibacter sp.]HYD77160.1 hypothetical protein [Ramlibacter sp.]
MDFQRIASAAVLAATGLLGGCAVYSDYPGYATYPAAPEVYGAAPVVVAPAPVYAAPPPWYGPSISIGISGRSGHRHRRDHDHDRGGREHRRHGGHRH